MYMTCINVTINTYKAAEDISGFIIAVMFPQVVSYVVSTSSVEN